MKNIDNNIFHITSEIIYDIIHSLHRHRREEHLKKERSSPEKKLQKKESFGSARVNAILKQYKE